MLYRWANLGHTYTMYRFGKYLRANIHEQPYNAQVIDHVLCVHVCMAFSSTIRHSHNLITWKLLLFVKLVVNCLTLVAPEWIWWLSVKIYITTSRWLESHFRHKWVAAQMDGLLWGVSLYLIYWYLNRQALPCSRGLISLLVVWPELQQKVTNLPEGAKNFS